MKRSVWIGGFLVLVLALGLGAPTASGQGYPNRPIQLIIPGAAGSILDIAGRLTGKNSGKTWGRNWFP